jgi:hypothetical protein
VALHKHANKIENLSAFFSFDPSIQRGCYALHVWYHIPVVVSVAARFSIFTEERLRGICLELR